MSNKTLLLLDFDETITTKDTFPLFVKFDKGVVVFISVFALFSPLLFLYKLKLYDGGKIKEKILALIYKNELQSNLFLKGEQFINYLLNNELIKLSFIELINEHKKLNSDICIVSASPNIWIKPFANKYQINCISTELNFNNLIQFTGQFKTKNCVAIEKAIRIKQNYNLNNYTSIIAYGNSNDDNEMFKLASVFYKV